MFLRRYERRSGRRRRTSWALVESVRTGRGSRQRVVAYRGDLKRSEQSGWAQLGRTLSGKQRPTPSWFDPPHYNKPSADEPVLVRLRGVRRERLRDFGDVWMALGLWRLLGLDTLLESLAPGGREGVPWPVVAAILTIARFCQPQSELHIESTWYRGSALEELLGVRTNLHETDPAILWKRYIQLTDAEWAFRIHKDELDIRPLWHQKQDRVLARIFICFLA